MMGPISRGYLLNCLNHGFNGLKDDTDFVRMVGFYNLCNRVSCLNHGLNGLKDDTDFVRRVIL